MANIPQVFISSTSMDLEPYRDAAREAVLAAEMLPVMSDNFAAKMTGPLKGCLEKVAKSDLVVVLVAHRYGWIPPEQQSQNPRKSITWLECEQAVCDGHKILGFLIGHKGSWPTELKEQHRIAHAVETGTASPELLADVMGAVDGLKAFQGWLKQFLCKFAETPGDLRADILQALNEWRLEHWPDGAATGPVATSGSPEKYLTRLYDLTSRIDIRGLSVGTGEAHQFPIEDLFITLQSRRPSSRPAKDAGKRPIRDNDPKSFDPLERNLTNEVPLHEALSERRLVVIGDPGAGKTTFLRRVASTLCLTESGKAPEAAMTRLGIDGQLFPILVRCATLANHLKMVLQRGDAEGTSASASLPTDPTSALWLSHYLATESRENGTGLDQAFFLRQLESGRCTVMLDGLDEAADPIQRDNLSKLVEKLTQVYAGCRFVVTSRPVAYTGTIVLPDFVHVEIAPLSDDAVDTFLAHWCQQLYGGDTEASRDHCRELVSSLHARPEIRRVARTPVMLTALAVVHWNERRLPEQRAEMYESVITWLSRSRQDRPGREKPERTVTLLQELALAMQDHPDGRQTQVSKRWAAEFLAPHFGPKKPTAKSLAAAEGFLTDEELDSGIVVALGNEIRFWHLQFQEFLAARAIAGLPDSDQRKLLHGTSLKLYRPEWREVILLLAGALHKQGAAKVAGFVQQVLDGLLTATSESAKPTKSKRKRDGARDEEPQLAIEARCAALLGGVFHDLRPAGYQPAEPRYDALLHRVMGIFDRERSQTVDVTIRIAAAEALGQVGDPRLEFNARDRWVDLPGGSYLQGSQKDDPTQPNYDTNAYDYELPVHRVHLAPFSIGRFPVTVFDYQRFMEHDGYVTEKYWKRGGGFGQFTEPEDWSEQLAHKNRPVVGVSWFEAMAYCECFGDRLPTEAEWEFAARGTTGRKFPWGNPDADSTRLNFDGNIGAPTPVGIFPQGATPEGVEDLAGNVWEWCWDWYGEYSAKACDNPQGPKQESFRVLRGGSWYHISGDCRSAIRFGSAPDNRDVNVGFRVVRSVRTS